MHAALVDAGVDFAAVDYYTDPIPKAKLQELLRKLAPEGYSAVCAVQRGPGA